MVIYLHKNGERAGPFTLEKIQARLDTGELSVSDPAWFEGCSDWLMVQDVPGILLPGGDHLSQVATVPPFDAYQGDEPYVFASYAHKDAAMVYGEITRFHEAGCNVWYDEGIDASNEWPEEIAKAVIGCAVFLIFVTPRATASVNCRNEVNLALNKNKPFLAIYLEETELPPGLQLRMGDLQAIFRYNIPVDRYERKSQGALYQLLGTAPTKKLMKEMFGTSLSPELLEQMVESGEMPNLGGEETQITAYFSDVQAFSSFSGSLEPSQLVAFMNEYLTAMLDVLYEQRGTFVKYIGDAIVAMFGAPIPFPDHPYQAVKTGLLMLKRQAELREKWKGEGDKWPDFGPNMQTRVGCNTGNAIVGNMGAVGHFEYSMMGDTVNLGARCESAARAYGAFCMVTEDTQRAAEATKDDIAYRYLDKIVVKGRPQPVSFYEPVGFKSDLTQEVQDCLDCFGQGIEKYLAQDWDSALEEFEKAKPLEPNQPNVTPGADKNPSMVLIERCQAMKENPPGDDWDGVGVYPK
ncbi:MAG: TIR domain-containing protein [Opitutae bacterium]|nr:TIR domain-containing protein [Opitutae bacterium]